jgi:hypothetical protein
MLNLTPFVTPLFRHRADSLLRSAMQPEITQRGELRKLLNTARATLIGSRHNFAHIRNYEEFAAIVPLSSYEDIRPLVMRMLMGENDILWPGVTRRFAQSSGTSDGRSKFIPVTDHSLRLTHYRGAAHVVEQYLKLYPDSRLLGGRSFILGGSFANELTNLPAGVKVGDLSANLIDAIHPAVNAVRIPSKQIALMEDWERKLPALVAASVRRHDITNISGVPSWFLTVLRRVIEAAGADTIHDVWPNLEVFFHGGISFEPYREQYRSITDPARMRYLETYNASEGFFAVQDSPEPKSPMLLMPDVGVFYEFKPLSGDADAEPVPAWRVNPGEVYALIITACNGLWRYQIGDTVKVETVEPLRISIAGRTRLFINAFGEELMIHNADAALARTCRELRCSVADYTAAPVFTARHTKGHHQWLVEFVTPPANIHEFASLLDRHLCEENSDYAAKRTADIFLAPPQVIAAPSGTFQSWLAATGKVGGQRKVPRLANDRHIIDPMLEMLRQAM